MHYFVIDEAVFFFGGPQEMMSDSEIDTHWGAAFQKPMLNHRELSAQKPPNSNTKTMFLLLTSD